MSDVTQLRRVYAEICRGYSEATYFDNEVYVAHFTTFDYTEIEAWQEEAQDRAVQRGIKTEAERLKWLNDKGIWTAKDETALSNHRMYVENLRKTRAKCAFKAQIDAIEAQLKEGETDLDKILDKRRRMIGITAEIAAEQQVQFQYVRYAFYRDRDLEYPLFSDIEMNKLDDEESDTLLSIYVGVVSRFSLDTIKRIAVQPFFANQFYLCADDIRAFFGLPIVDLTIYQANLLTWGQYYRNIFMHEKVPTEIATDPTKIDEFITRSANVKQVMAKTKQNETFVGVVGASSEDFKAMGAEDGTAHMNQMAAKQFRDGKDAAKEMGFVWVDKK